MPNEINAAPTSTVRVQASPALSQVIDLLLAAAPPFAEPTLGDIRASLLAPHLFWSAAHGELLDAQDQTALVIEVDELIERYGTDAHARDLIDRTTI